MIQTTQVSDDQLRAEIRKKAEAHAEATVYSLNNPYLSRREKAIVEAVYQFPFGVFAYSFAFFALAQNQTFLASYGWATGVSAVAWIFARLLPGRLFLPLGIIFAGNGATILGLGLAGYALWNYHWGVGAFLFLSSFGFASFVELPMWLWTATAGRLNPKYGIAKRNFGTAFPFESELD